MTPLERLYARYNGRPPAWALYAARYSTRQAQIEYAHRKAAACSARIGRYWLGLHYAVNQARLMGRDDWRELEQDLLRIQGPQIEYVERERQRWLDHALALTTEHEEPSK